MKIDKIISLELQNTLTNISKIFERFQKKYPNEIGMNFKDQDQLFAKYGWYIYDGTSLEEVLIILKLFNQGKNDLAQEKIINILENNIEDIGNDLSTFNNMSSHIIKEAIICHKSELFYASTILFVSLTDGIVNGKLFTKRFLEKIKKQNQGHFLLDIFNEENPVTQKFIPSKSSDSELMRHGIMHGNSTNYGNKINSLKALSLFHYISSRKHKLKY